MILALILIALGLVAMLALVLLLCRDDARKARAQIELLETENEQLRMRLADLTKLITRPRR